jgi:hypothetical protein
MLDRGPLAGNKKNLLSLRTKYITDHLRTFQMRKGLGRLRLGHQRLSF